MTTLTAVTAVLAGAAPVGITIAIGELVDGLTSAIGHGLGTPAARECYRWVALIVVLFFLTHLAESARTALGRALGRRVTGRLGERVMMAASEPATIGHLEDPAYLSRLGRARGDGTIDMPPGEAVFGFSTKASMWVTSIGSAALLTQVTWGLGLIVFADLRRDPLPAGPELPDSRHRDRESDGEAPPHVVSAGRADHAGRGPGSAPLRPRRLLP